MPLSKALNPLTAPRAPLHHSTVSPMLGACRVCVVLQRPTFSPPSVLFWPFFFFLFWCFAFDFGETSLVFVSSCLCVVKQPPVQQKKIVPLSSSIVGRFLLVCLCLNNRLWSHSLDYCVILLLTASQIKTLPSTCTSVCLSVLERGEFSPSSPD